MFYGCSTWQSRYLSWTFTTLWHARWVEVKGSIEWYIENSICEVQLKILHLAWLNYCITVFCSFVQLINKMGQFPSPKDKCCSMAHVHVSKLFSPDWGWPAFCWVLGTVTGLGCLLGHCMATQAEENKHSRWLQASGWACVLTLFSLVIAFIPKLLFFQYCFMSPGYYGIWYINKDWYGMPECCNCSDQGCPFGS